MFFLKPTSFTCEIDQRPVTPFGADSGEAALRRVQSAGAGGAARQVRTAAPAGATRGGEAREEIKVEAHL